MPNRNNFNRRGNTNNSPASPRPAQYTQPSGFDRIDPARNIDMQKRAAEFARDNQIDANAAMRKYSDERRADNERRKTNANNTPTRIFGAVGDAVQLGGTTYHLAVFTTRGTLEFQDFIQSESIPAVDGETAGEQFIGAALMTRNFAPIQKLLGWILAESGPNQNELTDDICDSASPSQLSEVINLFFKQNGLLWLETLVKTYGGRTMQILVEQLETSVTGILAEMTFDPPISGTDAT